MTRADDLFVNYLGAKAWLSGLNPYSHVDTWSMRPPDFPLQSFNYVSPYPPAVFPLSSPLALFDAASAIALFVTVTTALYVISCAFFLWNACGIQSQTRRLVALGCCLVGYPVQTGISLGQYSTLSFAFTLLAFSTHVLGHQALSALLLSLSLALKPQIGLALLIYFALVRNWQSVSIAIILYFLLSAVAVTWTSVSLGGIAWLADIIREIRNIDAQQAELYCCVNLRMITREIFAGEGWQRLADAVAFVGLFGVWLTCRNRARVNPVLEFATLSLIFILPVYHRPYDLVFIVLVIGWVSEVMPTERRPVILLALLVLFVLPIPTLGLAATLFPTTGPESGQFGLATRILVIPHTTWLLLALIFFLLTRMGTANSKNENSAIQDHFLT